MNWIAYVLLTAAVAFGVAKKLSLPAIPILVLAGIGLKLLTSKLGIQLPATGLQEVIELGLAVLVFTAGIDLTPQKIRSEGRAVAMVASCQFFGLGLASLITARLLNYDWMTSLYLASALSASSTLVCIKQLQIRRQRFEAYGRLTTSILLLQDIAIILLLVMLHALPEGSTDALLSVAYSLGVGLIALSLHQWIIPAITQRLKLDDETLMLSSLALLFAFSGLTYLLGLPFLVGAFYAGFALASFPISGLIRGQLQSLSSFFLALFFISIGLSMHLPSNTMFAHSLIFILLLIIVTIPLVSIVAEIVGYATRTSIETALLLTQTSEFSLVIAVSGVASGEIGTELFSMITLITITTMALTPLLAQEKVAWRLMRLHPRYRRGEKACQKMTEHAVLLGYGRAGKETLRLLEEVNIPVIVIDEDAAVVKQLLDRHIHALQADGSSLRALKLANCQSARFVVCSMRRTRDALTALKYLKEAPAQVLVRTFDANEVTMVQAAGGTPIPLADAALQQFLKWFAHQQNSDISTASASN
jgi:CPA2 family monovalent cation:H+ antiporter-2